MLEIVLATGNPHKIEEMSAIFGQLLPPNAVRLIGLKDLPARIAIHEPEESGSTFEANATIKAVSYAEQTGMPCLADDSGLEIDALSGRPGVISSHYCTDGREAGMSRQERDAANNARVLRELEGIPAEARSARFLCVMCLAGLKIASADPTSTSQSPRLVRGAFEGRIGIAPRVPRGANGFGYDPLFLVSPGFTMTSAELPGEAKNRLSHRAAAARLMAQHLLGIIG